MKKYSFVIWILALALLIGGGYYIVNVLGEKEADSPIATNNEPPENTNEEAPVDTPLETPTESSPQTPTVDEEDDYISSLKIEEPFQTDFIVFNDAGEEVSISDYQGKTVILNFWASWCPPCIDEMPEFEALHKKLDPEETVILALNVTDGQRETKKTANKFLETENIDLNVLYDEELNGATEFGISVIPQTYVIDKEGFVQFGLMGMTDEVVLNAMLERMK